VEAKSSPLFTAQNQIERSASTIMEDEEAMSKGLGGTPIYRTMTDTKAACTSWQSMPSRDYSSHEITWDARNTKA
jgi:hypothetical protein